MTQIGNEPAGFTQTYPVPLNELARLQALAELKVLDTPAEESFDAVVRQAARICETPIALISFVDHDRQWFKARFGFETHETPRHMAFCTHAILDHQLLEVPQALADLRFAENPLVTGQPGIRFYAGVPLVTHDGFALGTLCVMDREPRELNEPQRESLRDLASLVSALLDSRKTAAEATQLGLILNQAFDEILVLYPGSQHIQYANAKALANLGYRLSELQKMTVGGMGEDYPLDTLMALHRLGENADRAPLVFDAVHTRKDGSTYAVEVRATVSASPVAPQIILLANDISARKQAEDTLRRQATFDPVTGLSNRQNFESTLSSAMHRVRREGGSLALVMIEIDRLTEIRHSYGQQTADKVLAEFAARLKECTASKDRVAHLGGDEFVILLEDVADAIVVPALAMAILRNLEPCFSWEQSQIALSASVGAVYFAGGEEKMVALLDRADAAVNIAFLTGTHHHVIPLSSDGAAVIRVRSAEPPVGGAAHFPQIRSQS